MTRQEQIESLFHEALALPEDVDRVQWVSDRCEDSALSQEVVSLMRAHMALSSPGAISRPGIPTAKFGVYRAVEVLGRGGMSVVYRAERMDGQFDQTVALKVMASYLVDPNFLERFEMERRLLAALVHNNIARLLDGGVSSIGDPYLVTEYIDGEPVDRYCDEQRLEVSARLRLFLQICEAVDYAHRNLIVHRDLKPANILVSREGTVKLLDFGSASLQSGQHNVTETRMRMLTPRYASPEQLRGDRVNISTDVFSLGVVLYELLSGAWPFGDPTSRLAEFDRVRGAVTARPPSVAVTEESAERRSVSHHQLRRVLSGDLSAIVLKALEQDPAKIAKPPASTSAFHW